MVLLNIIFWHKKSLLWAFTESFFISRKIPCLKRLILTVTKITYWKSLRSVLLKNIVFSLFFPQPRILTLTQVFPIHVLYSSVFFILTFSIRRRLEIHLFLLNFTVWSSRAVNSKVILTKLKFARWFTWWLLTCEYLIFENNLNYNTS